MASKITSWCQCSSWRQKVRHDINKYIMMLKVMEVKVMSWRQKVVCVKVTSGHVNKYVMTSKSTLSCQKVCRVCQSYVMTSKVCHDIKKYSYIITSKVHQKVRYDVKEYVMTSRLHQDVKIRHEVKVTLWRQKGNLKK